MKKSFRALCAPQSVLKAPLTCRGEMYLARLRRHIRHAVVAGGPDTSGPYMG
jgi:hypothetical protein